MRPPCRQGQACGDRRGPSPSSALTKLRLCRLVPSLPFAPDCTPPCLWLFVPLAKRTAVWLANKTIFRGRPDHDDQNENRPRRHLHTDYQRDGKGRRRRKRWQEPYSCACCLLNLVRRRRHASRKCLAGIVWTGRTNGWCDGPSSPEKGREWYLRNREKILARNKEKYRQETKKVEGTFFMCGKDQGRSCSRPSVTAGGPFLILDIILDTSLLYPEFDLSQPLCSQGL